MGVALNVQVVKNGQVLGQHQFDSDVHRTIKIGRLPSAQLKIEDPKVSRIHAVIEFAGNEISLIDMGSSVGTVVNGAKIHKVKLNPGDQVMIGDIQLVIGVGDNAAAMPAQPPMAAAPPGMQPLMPAPSMTPPQVFVPPGMSTSVPGGMTQPRFDDNQASAPIRRITKERLHAAAVESRPHPALPAEESMTKENRLLEMRVYWGEVLLGVYHYKEPKAITIGETKRTDFFISSEGLPSEEYPIMRYMDGEYLLTFTNTMEGEVEIGGELNPLQVLRGSSIVKKDSSLEASYSMALPPESRAILHWGGATFALRFVAPARGVPKKMFENMDLAYMNMLLLSLFFHVSLVVTALVYPYDTEALREDLFSQPDRFAKLVLEPQKEKKSTQDMLKKMRESVEKKQEAMKEKEPPPDKNKVVVPQITDKPRPKKTEAQKQAEVKQKFTKLFAGAGGSSGAAGSILGGGGGGSLSGTLSNVIGTAGAGSATAGLAGFGIRGGGPLTGGGMGTSRGIAGIGTAGRGGGGGMGYGSGVGIGGHGNRNLIGFSTPVVMGALPREVIQKVINENKQQIRYCYEVELQRKQDLEGKVGVKWIIAATGMVAKVMVTESTLKNKNVENCIMAKIQGWKFPAPAGGGIVEVNYPFVFRASG